MVQRASINLRALTIVFPLVDKPIIYFGITKHDAKQDGVVGSSIARLISTFKIIIL